MRWHLAALTAFLWTSPDILPPGHKGLHHTYRLTGLERFPEYRFLHAPVHLKGWKFLEDGEEFRWYKLHGTRIYAVRNGVEIPEEFSAEWLSTLAKTGYDLHIQSSVRSDSPYARRRTVYELKNVSTDGVEIALVKDEYFDKAGKVLKSMGFRPGPVQTDASGSNPFGWLLGLSLGAVLLLVVLRLRS